MPITLGTVARRLGVDPWKVQRCIQRGFFTPSNRLGHYRVIEEAELPAFADAMRQAGYLDDKANALALSA